MSLANSRSCVGNLIGFNSGGYKALSCSLDIQVSFTKTTLFTPRRCFERVVEKCYDDSLSSIVESYFGVNMRLLEQDHSLTSSSGKNFLHLVH